jgi:N6-L-threonylcarbamoyladenine synthase
MDFPFLSVLATGGHTEIVLTRGVGLHTVMGFTIDLGVGTFLDRAASEVLKRSDLLNDK